MIIILAGAVIVLGALLLLFMFIEAHRNIVLKKTIHLKGLSEAFNGLTIYFVSDIHRRRLSIDMLSRIDKPDIVIIGGDLTEKGVPFSRVGENLRRLNRWGVPVLFVWGNHDLYVDQQVLVYLLNKYHVKRIENDVFFLKKEHSLLNFIGVDDITNDRDRLEDALANTLPGYRILISHNPAIVDKLRIDHHIPLVISGHTHGGQIRLLGWGIRESGGVKTKPFGKLVISCGYGTTRFPLRFGAPPDTLLIRLESEEIGTRS